MRVYRYLFSLACLSMILLQGCRSTASSKAAELESLTPCALVLTPHQGNGKLDREIAHIQQKIHKQTDPKPYIEQLGWRFVEKARASYDPGFYKLAEQCAACLEARQPDSNEARLLRGHVLDSLHRFKEAEGVARELVARRGLAYDHGLLGDILMEQGKLDEAIASYQKFMDLKPGPQAYARAGHIRWLKGDLDGARALMLMSAQAAGQGDPEPAAWAYSRLSLFELQAGRKKEAAQACDAAISIQQDYAPGLLACGRVMTAEGRVNAAVQIFQRAVKLNPLPEYQWLLADALRAAKREAEANEVESQLQARGEAEDPRTLALFLATRGVDVERALRLTTAEERVRSDVHTLDAKAWALAAAGQFDEAYQTMQRALAEGTSDARFFLHAAVIAAKSGRADEAQRYQQRAQSLQAMLFPSEKEQLKKLKT